MTLPSGNLLGRVRRALGPGLDVDSELGRGGMGVVFAGRDPVLDRPVAIKVLRPEMATATAAERFLREGRLLAKVSHPSIIKVHQAGQADGLFYLVMDRADGERLADRLRGGRLPPATVVQLGAELLGAIAAIHAAGVLHRDVKPSNLMVQGGGVVLVDFGIASQSGSASELTAPGAQPGTPAYMAPEQAIGLPATVATDLWAVGATLFEAATGARYDPARSAPELTSLPQPLADALRRALEVDPAKRWASAEAFRAALLGVARARRIRWLVAATLALAASLALARWWPRDRAPGGSPTRRSVTLSPLVGSGAAASRLADSLERLLRARLAGYPDFELVREAGEPGVVVVEGTLSGAATGFVLELGLRDSRGTLAVSRSRVSDPGEWASLADSAADAVVLAILTDPLRRDPWTPSAVLPESPAGLRRFLEGERAYASGRWEQALVAYLEAERVDTTCLLCSYRLEDVDRWLNRPLDLARAERLRRSADRFPPHYRVLIEAETLPVGQRLDSLEAATRRFHDFDLVWYRYGEELFHRGPFAGRLSAESGPAFRETVRMRPDFAPAWNHLAWVSIVERDSLEAARALAEYHRLEGESRGLPFVQLSLLVVAEAWRFDHGASGPSVTARVLADERLERHRLLIAGPRMMLALRAWDGAVWMGRRQAGSSDLEAARSGLLAESLARLAAGRLDAMAEATARLADLVPDDETRGFAAGLSALVALVEGDSIAAERADRLVAPLLRYLDPEAHRPASRRAAALLVGLVAHRARRPDLLASADRSLGDGPLADGYRRWLAAVSGSHDPDPIAAIDGASAAAPWILEEQPAARALGAFARARLLARAGRVDGAVRALRLADHQDLIGVPLGAPTRGEIEWALGPIARWQEAALLERESSDRRRRCHLYAEAAVDWRDGDPRFRERAALADSRYRALACGATP